MIYTKLTIDQLAQLVDFTATPDVFELFNEVNPTLGSEITVFHIKTTLLTAIHNLDMLEVPVSHMALHSYLMYDIFKGQADPIALDKRLVEYLPKLIDDELIDADFEITDSGHLALYKKIEKAHFSENKNPTIN